MTANDYRAAIAEYIRQNAQPPDKFSHQPRLYELAAQIARGQPHDDDVLYAAAWLHDLGVFVGHRPEEPVALAAWDNVSYAIKKTPDLLKGFGFPDEKIPAVLEAIRTHQPSATPVAFEAIVLRDADMLEQLGAVGILRVVSKVGRDTRFIQFEDALRVLKQNLEKLPGQIELEVTRRLAQPRVQILREFIIAAEREGVFPQ